jgi:hypothetical protein
MAENRTKPTEEKLVAGAAQAKAKAKGRGHC